MKKLFVTLITLLVCTIGYTQIPKQQSLQDFGTWSVTPFMSAAYQNSDLDENDPFYTSTPIKLGWGINAGKQLSHFTSAHLNFFNNKWETDNDKSSYTTNLSQLSARFQFNITNGLIFRKWSSTQLYAFAGYGIIWYDAERISKMTFDTITVARNNTRVIPIGLGAKYRLGNRTSLNLELVYNQSNSDKLDAWGNSLTQKDGFTQFTAGFSYTLGKKKILEWDNPYQYLVPETVHDTTVVIQKIETAYVAPVVPKPDSVIVYYIAGHYQIEQMYLKVLDDLLERARDEGYGIEIMAYCDSSGTSEGNYELVTKRADKVASYAKHFISENAIKIYRYDESWAVYAPEARNRKVVVKLIK